MVNQISKFILMNRPKEDQQSPINVERLNIESQKYEKSKIKQNIDFNININRKI